MKGKVYEATGAVLDWMVAKAQGAKLVGQSDGLAWMVDGALLGYLKSYSPSTDWEYGGPIIDREHIGVAFNGGQWVGFYMVDELDEYDWDFRLSTYGPTSLIAAMRCYVASKLDYEVDVPEELFK